MKEATDVIPHPHPNNKQFVDLTGEIFSRMTVLCFAGKRKTSAMWWCKCSCGNTKMVHGAHLKRGLTRSCGCLSDESKRSRVHKKNPMRGSPESGAHKEMIRRCYSKKHISWENYGGRGITVCDRWLFGEGGKPGFECFFEDMGFRPSVKHSLDRGDNDGNYCKENCSWATLIEQHNNTRANVKIERDGRVLTLSQWAREIGLRPGTLRERLLRFCDVEIAFTKPLRKYAKNSQHPHHATGKV